MKNQRIAAIFDVDGTLIAGATLERIFIRFLRRRGELGWREIVYWIGAAAKAAGSNATDSSRVTTRYTRSRRRAVGGTGTLSRTVAGTVNVRTGSI